MKVRQLRLLAKGLVEAYKVSVNKACRAVLLYRSAWYYKAHRREDRPLRRRIREIAAARVRYGMWRIFVLLRREGWKDNHKRVHRIYKEEGLNLRSKRPGEEQSRSSQDGEAGKQRFTPVLEYGFCAGSAFRWTKVQVLNYSR